MIHMGFWGTKLYENDVSCDVRDTYLNMIKKHKDVIEAFNVFLILFQEYLGTPDEPILWYALADTQWDYGHMMTEVSCKAIEWIDQRGGLELWSENPQGAKTWDSMLMKLKAKLTSPQPPAKTITEETDFNRNPWEIGDIFAYRFSTQNSKTYNLFGKYILFQKIGNVKLWDGNVYPRLQMFDEIFIEIPTLSNDWHCRILPFDKPDRFMNPSCEFVFTLDMNGIIFASKEKDYPKKRLFYITNRPIYYSMPFAHVNTSEYSWNILEDCLCEFYQSWRNKEYVEYKGEYVCNLEMNVNRIVMPKHKPPQ